jgi:hypothetical protein
MTDDQAIQEVLVEETETEKVSLTAKAKLLLKARFDRPEWETFFEVHGDTGHLADFIAFNMLPSRNHLIVGMEIKASRADWLNELRNGHKADFFLQHCDEWYIVEAKLGIVSKTELPKGWGLISARNSRLFTRVHSDLPMKGDISRHMFMMMLRKAAGKNLSDSLLYEAEMRGYDKGRKAAVLDNWDLKELQRKASVLDKLDQNGLYIYKCSEAEIRNLRNAMEVITLLKGEKYGSLQESLESLKQRHLEFIEELKKCMDKIKVIKEFI